MIQRCSAYLAEEPSDEVAKDNSLVGLVVVGWGRDAGQGPQIAFPLIQFVVARPSIKQEDTGSSIDQPTTVKSLDATVIHRLDGGSHGWITGLKLFDFDSSLQDSTSAGISTRHRWGIETHRSSVPRTKESVGGAILGGCDLGFGLEDRVDTADCSASVSLDHQNWANEADTNLC